MSANPGFVCSGGSSSSATSCHTVCGDGRVAGNEGCDDANNGGCLSNCLDHKAGYSCTGGTPTSRSVCSIVCGDGILVGGETCDDGGLGGCVSNCMGPSPGY